MKRNVLLCFFLLLNCILIRSEEVVDPIFYSPFHPVMPQNSPIPINHPFDYGLGYSNPLILTTPDAGGDIDGGGGTGIGREELPIDDSIGFLFSFSLLGFFVYRWKRKRF